MLSGPVAGRDGGSGVVVLPCGAGKTIVGIASITRAQAQTLIVCFGTVAAHQWIRELLDKTDLTPDLIGEYTGDLKEVRPVTVATYQILTYHPENDGSRRAIPFAWRTFPTWRCLPLRIGG